MKHSGSRMVALGLAYVVSGALSPQVAGARASAQSAPPPVKRTILLQQDMSLAGREAVMVRVDLPPGSAEGRHTHHAEAYVFVEEGSIALEHDGHPTTTLNAGDVFHVPAGRIHQAMNTTNAIARLSAVFVAEKGRPLTVPVQ